ncbi:CPXCG motif-containing cysteine-rich protein [Gracilimonas mengyeensis]|uniref:Cysteine-rich CPXCG n=1 Tax=Gracilimonas mengyeensis TaxID=1302730 RepID=A0A521DIZ9_9BACT|nr:CPXCG motif-containing cysteine-rich protein [Gracilimonas mengyeensis]SMO70900.1 Cysteine-rich CPXCG [Gracilimonas mengyeensis]
MEGTYEHTFMCLHCGAQINMILESYYPEQEYIEDCEVCCNPIQIHYKFEGENLAFFNAQPIGQ